MAEKVAKRSGKEVEWRQRLTRFGGSAQQVKAFCQAELISEASFYRWRKLLADADSMVPAAGFIDVGMMPSAPTPTPTPLQSTTQEDLAGATLDVRLDLGQGLVLHIVRR